MFSKSEIVSMTAASAFGAAIITAMLPGQNEARGCMVADTTEPGGTKIENTCDRPVKAMTCFQSSDGSSCMLKEFDAKSSVKTDMRGSLFDKVQNVEISACFSPYSPKSYVVTFVCR